MHIYSQANVIMTLEGYSMIIPDQGAANLSLQIPDACSAHADSPGLQLQNIEETRSLFITKDHSVALFQREQF